MLDICNCGEAISTCSEYETLEMRVRRGACGFSRGVYQTVNDPKKNAKATKYNDAYAKFAVA